MSHTDQQVFDLLDDVRRRAGVYRGFPVVHASSPRVAVEFVMDLCDYRYALRSLRRKYHHLKQHSSTQLSFEGYVNSQRPNMLNFWDFISHDVKHNLRVYGGELPKILELENAAPMFGDFRYRSAWTRPHELERGSKFGRMLNMTHLLQHAYLVNRSTPMRGFGHIPASLENGLNCKLFHPSTAVQDFRFFQEAHAERFAFNRLGCIWIYKQFSMVVDEPTKLSVSPANGAQLHSENDYAVQWSDGWGICALQGLYIDSWKILEPEKLKAEEVMNEENTEIRRVLLDKIGLERVLDECGGTLLDESEYGKLYNIRSSVGQSIKVVSVVNSTQEPDGTYKRYVLRVPPNVDSAREAIAWTFELPTKQYAPSVET